MTVGERIKEVRKDNGLTMEKFGERLGLTKMSISRVESGATNASNQMIKSIAREFSVSADWLIDGTGEKIAVPKQQADLAKLSKAVLDEPNGGIKSKIISLLANLPEEYWEMIADLAERLASEPDEEE